MPLNLTMPRFINNVYVVFIPSSPHSQAPPSVTKLTAFPVIQSTIRNIHNTCMTSSELELAVWDETPSW